VYRILKKQSLITAPSHILLSAADEFKDKTNFAHEMWQADFTCFKIIGWGWYHLSTVLNDYSQGLRGQVSKLYMIMVPVMLLPG